MEIFGLSCQEVPYKVLVPCRVALGEGILLFWDKWKIKHIAVKRETTASHIKEEEKKMKWRDESKP